MKFARKYTFDRFKRNISSVGVKNILCRNVEYRVNMLKYLFIYVTYIYIYTNI